MLAFNSSLNEKDPEVTVWPVGRETPDPSSRAWEGGPWAFGEMMLNASLALTEINCEQTAQRRAKQINICKRKSNRLLTAQGSPGSPSMSPGAWLWARLRRQHHFSPSWGLLSLHSVETPFPRGDLGTSEFSWPERSSQDAALGGSGLEREAVSWLRLALKGWVESLWRWLGKDLLCVKGQLSGLQTCKHAADSAHWVSRLPVFHIAVFNMLRVHKLQEGLVLFRFEKGSHHTVLESLGLVM